MELWGLCWPRSRLLEIGLGLGADVPFFLGGQNAWVEGIGERLSPVTLPAQWLAVLKPPVGIDTRAIFNSPLVKRDSDPAILAGLSADGHADPARISAPIKTQTEKLIQALTESGRNDLQAAAEGQSPEVTQAADLLLSRFGNSRMTGSGSAVFARVKEVDGIPVMPENPAPGWTGRMCRSLTVHPLREWAEG